MNCEEAKLKGLLKSRFDWIIFLLRLAGIPFMLKKISAIYTIYIITVFICTFSTYIGMSADVYLHMDDLGRAMTNILSFFLMTNIIWLYLNCRYVTKLFIALATSQAFVYKQMKF